ncbi:MAG: rhodanese-like domain-containing protein [Patescibacteria group bacterium]|nr:rhodanese-like domain-containing protein [Patescibacteria group bacterium]
MPDKKIPHITCEHLQKIKQEGGPDHTVVDLRDTLEYDAGHIEGSHNVPRRELTDNIENIVPHKSHKVIVVVGATLESEIGFIHEELTEMGYEEVEFLAGGFDQWCTISMPSVDDIVDEGTPEEKGARSDGRDDYEGNDPEEENEPMY